MTFTELIGEILIIGIGTTCWLGLILAAVSKYTPRVTTLKSVNSLLFTGLITAMTYVFGVVTDRTVRQIFIVTVEAHAQHEIITEERISEIKKLANYINEQNVSMELEEFIRYRSDALGKRIDYNRSRLRICRAWTLHFLLIGIAFFAWNVRAKITTSLTTAVFLAMCVALSLLTFHTAYRLSIDHQRNLIEAFRIITGAGKRE